MGEIRDWQVMDRAQWPLWVLRAVFSNLVALRDAGECGETMFYQGIAYEYRVTLGEGESPRHWDVSQIERRVRCGNRH